MSNALELALEALENSLPLVENDYLDDWRHGLNSRKAQLAGVKKELDDHITAIAALKVAIKAQGEPVATARVGNGGFFVTCNLRQLKKLGFRLDEVKDIPLYIGGDL